MFYLYKHTECAETRCHAQSAQSCAEYIKIRVYYYSINLNDKYYSMIISIIIINPDKTKEQILIKDTFINSYYFIIQFFTVLRISAYIRLPDQCLFQ